MRRAPTRSHALVLATIVGMLAVLSGPAPATAETRRATGFIRFEGTAVLPRYPCPGGGCFATLNGDAVVALRGMRDGNPWEVVATVPVDMAFMYGNTCFGVGIANGIADVSGPAAGRYGPQLVPVGGAREPVPVTGIHMPLRFRWTRVGAAALMVVEAISGWATVAGQGDVQVFNDQQAVGLATFVTTAIPDCFGGWSLVKPQVSGLVLMNEE